jgi:hypothetical protein
MARGVNAGGPAIALRLGAVRNAQITPGSLLDERTFRGRFTSPASGEVKVRQAATGQRMHPVPIGCHGQKL